jgi:hypothetical protein
VAILLDALRCAAAASPAPAARWALTRCRSLTRWSLVGLPVVAVGAGRLLAGREPKRFAGSARD